MTSPCTFLNWDTDFFGFRTARVNDQHLTPDSVHEIDLWCQAEAIDCLYFLADPNDSQTVRLAEDHGYRFVDLRLTFERKLGDDEVLPLSNTIRPFTQSDLEPLIQIARGSYTDSRFYFDPCFPRAKCDLFYETWICNSTNGSGFADVTLVAELNGLTAGFITCKCRETIGHIGLVGVAEAARGRSLGLALVNNALQWFREQGMTSVQVVTQGRNIIAQRLYQRCGFLTSDLGLWYHKWFNDCRKT
jgi:dTDP-4-amino-4,6-dideoxy-D-galactose acyltransferase